jgi:hypothetical protein
MTERLRKILKGGKIDPKTADEAAVKYAIDNAGGSGDLLIVTADLTVDSETTPWKLDFSNFRNSNAEITYEEIAEAVAAHKTVVLMADAETGGDDPLVFAAVANFSPKGIQDVVYFNGIAPLNDGIYYNVVVGVGLDNHGATVGITDLLPLTKTDPAPLIIPGTISDTTATSISETPLSSIYAAFEAGRTIYFEANVGNGRGRFECNSVELNAGTYTVVYAAPMIITGKPAVYEIKFAGSDTTGTATVAVGS